MSSHREAPEISKDPVADNTDVYAFVSPDKPDTVTLIANYIPLEKPDGGPNFYEFGDDVRYSINVSNRGDARADISFEFRFTTLVRNPESFLYNTGPITSLDSPNWNRRQLYSVTKVTRDGDRRTIASGLRCPPCNIGPRSTPNYAALAAAAVNQLPSGRQIFAGQRAEGFFVDLGSIFDLGTLRPFQNLHLIPSAAAVGINGTQGLNVHSIALQIPARELTRDGKAPTDPSAAASVIGVWAAAARQRSRIYDGPEGRDVHTGPFRQVSRLAMPLVNEVLIPMGKKDRWNSQPPHQDGQFLTYVEHPELARLLPVLYPGVFPNLAGLSAARADLVAIFLTGLPAGVVAGFQNFTGPLQADLLRLNMAIRPTPTPNPLGLVAGDAAGFPNGRRVFDDVVTVELRGLAGATYPLVNPAYTPDAAAVAIADGTGNTNPPYLDHFPYLGTPAGGYQTTPGTPHT